MLGQEKIFLCHTIDKTRISHDPEKVSAIPQMKTPTTYHYRSPSFHENDEPTWQIIITASNHLSGTVKQMGSVDLEQKPRGIFSSTQK